MIQVLKLRIIGLFFLLLFSAHEIRPWLSWPHLQPSSHKLLDFSPLWDDSRPQGQDNRAPEGRPPVRRHWEGQGGHRQVVGEAEVVLNSPLEATDSYWINVFFFSFYFRFKGSPPQFPYTLVYFDDETFGIHAACTGGFFYTWVECVSRKDVMNYFCKIVARSQDRNTQYTFRWASLKSS